MERVMDPNSYTYQHHIKRYEYASKFVENKTVCSVACGIGYGERFIAEQGSPEHIYAFDIDRNALDYARKNNSNEKITFSHIDDFDKLIQNDSIDVFLSLETIEHIEKDVEFLDRVWRSLKQGGELIISTPNKAFSYRNLLSKKPLNKYHIREYKKDELVNLLSEKFNNIEVLGQKRILKRSLKNIWKYLFYHLTKKLADYEPNDFDIKPFPTDKEHEMAYILIKCRK
ncbi:MAG: methyltransferase domain-containing protein [Patescibacteria group bacterium]|nr:methyltransferase domain-containing protein [Patescibacteria group bacterium]